MLFGLGQDARYIAVNKITDEAIVVQKFNGRWSFSTIPPLYTLFGKEMEVNRLLLTIIPMVATINIFSRLD